MKSKDFTEKEMKNLFEDWLLFDREHTYYELTDWCKHLLSQNEIEVLNLPNEIRELCLKASRKRSRSSFNETIDLIIGELMLLIAYKHEEKKEIKEEIKEELNYCKKPLNSSQVTALKKEIENYNLQQLFEIKEVLKKLQRALHFIDNPTFDFGKEEATEEALFYKNELIDYIKTEEK